MTAAPYSNPDYQPAARMPKPRRRWPWVLGVVAALILGMIIGSAGKGSAPTSAAAPAGPVTSAPAGSTTQPAAPATVAAAGPKTEFGDGTFKVGEDIAAGTYKSSGPRAGSVIPNCYWARMKNDSGAFDAIIANNTGQGPARVTVKAGEYLQVTGCDFSKA